MKNKHKFKSLLLLTLSLAATSQSFSQVKAEEVKVPEDTKQALVTYQSRLTNLSDELASNTVKLAQLQTEISAREKQVAAQLRSAQVAQGNLSDNVLVQVFFNGQSWSRAFAISKLVQQSRDNLSALESNKLTYEKVTADLKNQQLEAQSILTTLNDKYQAEEAAIQQKRLLAAAKPEVAKTGAPAAGKNPADKAATPSPSPNSTNWADWPPAAAAQYVADRTGEDVSWWLAILYRESGGNPTIVNSIGCFGYFQMNGPAHGIDYASMSPGQYLDAVVRLYQGYGRGAWAL